MKLNIRSRLSIQFTLIVFSILLLFIAFIYIFQSNYREQEFFSRLEARSLSIAKLLIEVEEIDQNLLKIIEKNNINSLPEETIIIYDPENKEIYHSSEHSKIIISDELIEQIRSGKKVELQEGKYEILGITYQDKGQDFVLIASAWDKYGKSKLANLRLLLLVGFFISAGGVLLAGWIFAGRALKPMSNVVNQVDEIGINNIYLRVDEGNKTDEIAQLAITFNRMLDRLEEAFEIQRSFVSNASHELRTPLTAITGQIEVSLMKERSAEEYKKILLSVLEDIKSLNKLSNGLLDLAAASSQLSNVELKECRIDDLLWECRSALTKRNASYVVNILFRNSFEDENELTVICNESLLKTALMNIMDNACKYSPDHTVEIELGLSNHQIELTVKDQGDGIDQEDLEHIFQPFFRGKNSIIARGHGLGLALTQKIIHLHRGKITISSQKGKGTRVQVNLPAAKN